MLDRDTEVELETCVENAITRVREINRIRGRVGVLVTGYIHLVGSTLTVLNAV